MLDSLMERFNAFWLSLRLTWHLFNDERVPMFTKIIPVLAVLYIFSPIDILPDFFLIIGQLDDYIILTMAFDLFTRLAPEEVVEEHRQKLRAESQ